jgi:heptose II phosphotransferase
MPRRAKRPCFDVDPAWREIFPDARAAAPTIEREPDAVIHESARGRVATVDHPAGRLVIKHSFLERTSRWRRILSLFRPAEGVRAFRATRALRLAGVRVPEAVFGLERRRWGLAVDSWHVYRFVDGRAARVEDAEELVRALRALHVRGWVHGDPHLGNFLIRGHDVLLLDCSRVRRSWSPYARAFDFVLLEKCCRGLGGGPLVLPNEGPWTRLARTHSRALVAWRRMKRWLRSPFRVSGRGGAAS